MLNLFQHPPLILALSQRLYRQTRACRPVDLKQVQDDAGVLKQAPRTLTPPLFV